MFKFSKKKTQGFVVVQPGNRRLLMVEVLEARNILACDKKKGTSDPYVQCCLLDLGDREMKSETFRTQQKSNTLNPAFNESFSFGNTYDLDTNGELPSIKISMFHKGGFAVSETPIGDVLVSLHDIDPTGAATELWYPLKKSGRMPLVDGELHLRFRFSAPVSGSDADLESGPGSPMDGGDGDEAGALLEDEEAEADEEDPNELVISVVQARNLIVMDKQLFRSGGSSDPLVRLRMSGYKDQETSYIRKTLEPVWNEKFTWAPVTDASLSIQVTCLDFNDLSTRGFMGRCIVPLLPFINKKSSKQWYTLLSKEGSSDGTVRGEVELSIQWKFNLSVKEAANIAREKKQNSLIGKIGSVAHKASNLIGGGEDDSDLEDADDMGVESSEVAAKETDEEKELRVKKEAEKMKELEDIDIKSGDYQIQVHVIEARDLKAENFDGTSDPITYVELFGQKQSTSTKYNVTSCVYDELLIFNIRDLDKEAFQEGVIRITVMDANSVPFAKNTTIGAYAFDATQVYTANKDHEMYRKWVALMDDDDAEDVGVQGYLKISVQILGPGDKIKVHDEDAELAKEIAQENKVGGDIGSLVMSVPTIRKDWKFIVVSIYRAESLPVMDGKVGSGIATIKSAGTDAFCQLQFAGGKPMKTKVVTVLGESCSAINPIFEYELWYPVSVPSMTQIIKFTVWDHDPEKNEMIGQIIEKLSKISSITKSQSELVRWYNLYGAPEFKTDKLLETIKKGAKTATDTAKTLASHSVNYQDLYNNVPDRASTFKGRVLLKFRVADKRPSKFETPEVKPFKLKIRGPARLTAKSEPRQGDYVLKALVVSGSELPAFTEISAMSVVTAGTKKQDLQVRIMIGHHELATRPAKFELGMCRWNELLRSTTLKLPDDPEQLPDIFIYLYNTNPGKPICFARIKPYDPKTKQLIGFAQPAKWHLLQEDKVVDALNDDDFPGNVLIKLGFGRSVEADNTAVQWSQCLEKAKLARPYQVRVHVYQAKDVPAADSNGLCDPYVVVNFMGSKQKTETRKKTLFPEFYQTLIFNDVNLAESDDFQYSSQVNFRVYDHDDFDSDDYLGTFSYDMKDAFITENPEADLPDPKWFKMFKEVPNDGAGEVLVLVQLIPTMGAGRDKLKIVNSIKPETMEAFIEIIAVGIRDMAPFHFQAMQAPFLEIELNSMGTKYLQTTATSKVPNPSNPNFLERIVLPCVLPMRSIFATPLQLRARDTRLGGYLKPLVGVGTIDLVTKIPWCLDTYQAPQSDVFYTPEQLNPMELIGGEGNVPAGLLPGGNNDDVALSVMELANKRDGELICDDFIATQEQANVGDFIKRRVKGEDTGAGVFGALTHINVTGEKKSKAENVFVDPDWSQDDGDQPPAWSINRKVLEGELEVEYKTTPFETYPLTRGQANGMLGSTLKVVGKFKGLIRVMMTKDEPSLLSKELMEALLKPKGYKIRLYCLKAVGLTPMDKDMFGKPAKSDPYLKVRLGKDTFNDRANAIDDVTDTDLYKMIEFNAELPGTSQLILDVMDKNDFNSDGLIGRTIIDLEDRWFDNRWQQEGDENKVLPGEVSGSEVVRWQTKPIERRSLFVASNHCPQGVIECWVDIMKPEVAAAFPPDDVSLPPTQMFEVRVVIWKSKDVPAMDSFEGMSDLFVKAWPEGCDPQETDTHWRCKKGKASWNWRLVFDVELGHNTRAMKFPYFHLQLWDRDLLKWNDCAGEGTINLGKYYKKAFKRNIPLKLFEKKKGAQASRAIREAKHKRDFKVIDDGEDIPPEEEESDDEGETKQGEAGAAGADGAANGDGVAIGKGSNESLNPMLSSSAPGAGHVDPDSDDDDEDEDGDNGHDHGVGALSLDNQRTLSKMGMASDLKSIQKKNNVVSKKLSGKDTDKKDSKTGASKEKVTVGWGSYLISFVYTPAKEEGEEEKEEEMEALVKKEDEKDEDSAEMLDFITTIKNMTGLWDIDPEDSDWYKLEQHDHNTGKATPMGAISYSIQIWPKDKAVLFPTGTARNEPNTNPFLPPPVGRLKFSWNPFVLGSELCGPKICSAVFCCLVCLTFILLMIFCQPFLNILINILFFFG